MSKLSKETIDKINSEADLYGFVVPYDGRNKFYNDNKVKGYKAGATEWAGKAQGLIDALERIANGDTDHPQLTAVNAIAKYKEVSNER